MYTCNTKNAHTCTHTLTHLPQLCELLTQTISHYVSLFAASNIVRLPQFKLQLCLESGQMEFYPSLSDLETALLSTVHTVANAMSSVPNIQVHKCFSAALSVILLITIMHFKENFGEESGFAVSSNIIFCNDH